MPSTRYQKINAHHYRHIWVVGDIHGEYQLLQSRLHQLSFYPETDLLISTGDNIDRGPKSLNVLRLLNQPWFTSVKGNHEAMALEAFETGDGNMWLASGGDWFFDLNDSEQQEAIDLLLDRVQKSLNGELQQINGADYFIFGHMMFDNIQTFANQIYIDTGSPNSGRLSFYKIK